GHLTGVEIEERAGDGAGHVLARLVVRPLGDVRAQRLNPLVPDERARLEQILLEREQHRRRLVLALIRLVAEQIDTAQLRADRQRAAGEWDILHGAQAERGLVLRLADELRRAVGERDGNEAVVQVRSLAGEEDLRPQPRVESIVPLARRVADVASHCGGRPLTLRHADRVLEGQRLALSRRRRGGSLSQRRRPERAETGDDDERLHMPARRGGGGPTAPRRAGYS